MKFSLHFTFQSPEQNWGQVYQETVKEVVAADRLGYDSILVSEHHFVRDGCMPSSMVVCGALAMVTKKVRLGTAVTLLPLHMPVKVAEDAAVIDNISAGRFILGVGIGNRRNEFEAQGIPFSERRSRFEEALPLVRRLMAEERVDFKGRHYELKQVSVTPRPIQKPHPPIWVGAEKSERAVVRAALFGDAWITAPITPVDILKRYFRVYKESLEKAGKDFYQRERPLRRDAYVAKDDETAWKEFEKPFQLQYHDNYFKWGALWDDQGNFLDPQKVSFDDYAAQIKRRLIVGSPDTVIGEVERYAKELEVNNIVFRLRTPGLKHEQVMNAIETIGRKVIPYFQNS